VPSPAELDRINYVNIGLMLASAALACVLPFELFLLSYAVLGPLHYLTQISWLHDRGWFTTGKWDWIPLALCGVVALEAAYGSWLGFPGSPLVAFGLGIVVAFVRNPVVKVATVVACVALAVPMGSWFPARVFFGALLTTVIHVYVFTGLFILAGSLKSRSRSGYASFAVFLACGLGLLLVQPKTSFAVTDYARENMGPFVGMVDAMLALMPSTGPDLDSAIMAVGRFLGFAYTYHYLNWFSKTGVIRWHEIGAGRMALIGGLWILSVALYLYDYATGLAALFFLSIVHVFLEFPLDARTFADIVTARRRPVAAPARMVPAGRARARARR
jgi:hypothetical protein